MRSLPIGIDRETPVPLWSQVAEQLQHLIRRGDLRTGERPWGRDRER